MSEQLANGELKLEEDADFQDFCMNIWIRHNRERTFKDLDNIGLDVFVAENIELLKKTYLNLIIGEKYGK